MKKILTSSLTVMMLFLSVTSISFAETTDPNETVEATPIQRVDTDFLDDSVNSETDLYILDEPVDGFDANTEPLLLEDQDFSNSDQGEPMIDAEVQELLSEDNTSGDTGRSKILGIDVMQFVVLFVVLAGIWGIIALKNKGTTNPR